MKLATIAIAIALFALLLPALALAANNTTTEQNLTPVSISQNATISMPTLSNGTMAKIGTFENGTVYISGGANATVQGNVLAVEMGEAAWMEYRDVYLFYRLPTGFGSVSFDYDLYVGEKSNVLLLDFADSLPQTGVKKGGVPDTAVLGLGTWTNRGTEIRGMDGIGGLMAFPQGAHHVEVAAGEDMLFLKIDGNTTAYNFYKQKKYLVIHLMVGDEKSFLHGTLGNLGYEGPPLDSGNPAGDVNTSGFVVPNMTLNGKANGTAGGHINLPVGKETTPRPANVEPKTSAGLNIWLALVAAAGFFVAWAIVYAKYLKR
jgi:hypothetical protein